ncbi:NADH-dependent flavin oxidoreductase [Lysinibacillus sp. KU-BSD001]|uniref:NADH-dependent flavin oxidoreductase n=1 Tax=Lysinibacillus sp. KU-BSD001 TaxID=3141328 RepID=UPI0036EBD47B
MKFTQPFTLRSGLTLKNRVLMAPMTISSSQANGDVTEEELMYYNRRARGVGTVITACASINELAPGFTHSIGAECDERIPSLTRLAQAIQAGGASAILQIFHAGRMSNATLLGTQPVSASNIPALRPNAETPRPLTLAEIETTIADFAQATRRAIEAGFDGIELHGANTYLLQQFFSPHSNRRTDQWGGDVKARMAFPLAVVDAIKETIAKYATKPFAIGYRFSPEEREEPGITMDDTLLFINALADKEIDYLHVSINQFHAGSMRDAQDTRVRIQLIQEAVGDRMPIIGVGGLQTVEQVEEALTLVPLVSLGHAMIMDPEWYQKAESGQQDKIYPALYRSKEKELDIPPPLWTMITNVPGWFKVES